MKGNHGDTETRRLRGNGKVIENFSDKKKLTVIQKDFCQLFSLYGQFPLREITISIPSQCKSAFSYSVPPCLRGKKSYFFAV
jgi:hypothetical protein